MNINTIITDLLHFIEYVISNWQTIGAYSLGGITIATLAHKVERSRGFQDLQKFGVIIVALCAAAGSLIDFAINAHTQHWQVALPKDFSYLTTITLFLHKPLVAPVFEKAVSALTKFNSAVQELETFEAQVKAGQPLPSAVSPPNDNQFVA